MIGARFQSNVGPSFKAVFQHYKSGVLNGACGTNLDHGVLVVGLTDDAYIVKNSWGSDWGEINQGQDTCET